MDGLCIACWLTPAQAEQLALPGGEPPESLHVTLAYIPGDWSDADWGRMVGIAAQIAARFPPLQGCVPGLGVWSGDPATGDPLYASVDIPALPWLRMQVVEQLQDAGYPVSMLHGFSPHVTLAYLAPGSRGDVGGFTPVPLILDSISVVSPDMTDPLRIPFQGLAKEEPTGSESHIDVPLGSKRRRKPDDEADDTEVRMVKADQQQRLVYGVVLEPHEIDTQGDWETPDDIEQAAHRYLTKGWQSSAAWNTLQHRLRLEKSALVPVESFIAPVDFSYPENPDDVITKGSWVLVARVNSDALWGAVQAGTFTGWSVGGTGRRVDEPLPA